MQDTKNRHPGTITQLCWAVSLQLRHISTIGKKLVKQQYLLHMSSQYGKLRPTTGWDRSGSLGHPSKFQWVLHLGFVTAATSPNGSQPNFARCLAISWAGRLYIHFRRLLPHNGILQVQNSLSILQALCSPIGSVTARHSSSGHEPNFAALCTGLHLYSAGWPSCWALAHILVCVELSHYLCAAYWSFYWRKSWLEHEKWC